MKDETDALTNKIRSWCLAELASWKASKPIYANIFEELVRLNESKPNVFIFDIKAGIVSFRARPEGLRVHEVASRRAELYSRFIQDAVETSLPYVETSFALDVGDGGEPSPNVPIFAFQKMSGSSMVLFPDIDFLGTDFYANDGYSDTFEYDRKSASAIFVGSTTGGTNTAKAVMNLTLPRLRAAVHFKDNPRVRFLLPHIAQCDSKQTEDVIRGMGFGDGRMIPWKAQMMHKFIISMDGNGATCSRVLIALKSNSALIKYNSPHVLYYFRHMIPWLHYIPVESDDQINDIIGMELDHPGLFRFIASEGRAFAERYLNRAAVTLYAAELIRCYHDTIFLQPARKGRHAIEGETIAGRQVDDHTIHPDVACMGHIQGRGDVWVQGGEWVGNAGSNRWIEGITFVLLPRLGRLTYRAVLSDGRLTEPASDGEFCGTRGQSAPIFGLCIDFEGGAPGNPDFRYSATFTDGSAVESVGAGEICRSKTMAPLESLRVEISQSSVC